MREAKTIRAGSGTQDRRGMSKNLPDELKPEPVLEVEAAVAVRFCATTTPPLSFRSRLYRRGICWLPAAKQQIPRTTRPLRNDNSWGFSSDNYGGFPGT